MRFLRAEFPGLFQDARVRVYGNPGLRQTLLDRQPQHS